MINYFRKEVKELQNSEDLLEVSTMFGLFMKNMTSIFNKQGYEVNITQFKLLAFLNKYGAQNVSEIASALHITNAAVTGITDQLYEGNYITKNRSKKDKRVVNIEITDQGIKLVKKIKSGNQEIINSYFGKLTKEDINHLKRIFALLNESF